MFTDIEAPLEMREKKSSMTSNRKFYVWEKMIATQANTPT